jgi:hypothetical protein
VLVLRRGDEPPMSPDPTGVGRPVALAAAFDNVASTPAGASGEGGFNVWRNSFAAEELPSESTVVVDGLRFEVHHLGDRQPDNVRCDGQLLDVPAGRYDWLYLIAAAERRVEDEICLFFVDRTADFEPVRISDFWAAPPVFGETRALGSQTMHYPHHVQFGVAATMWCQRVPVTRRAELVGLRLPRNPALHVFAMTLLPAAVPPAAAVVPEKASVAASGGPSR